VTIPKRPFVPPQKLERDLVQARTFWAGLKRREAKMPFWDDVSLSARPRLAGKLILIEAFDTPVRFRCAEGVVGKEVKRQYAGDLDGVFLDEIEVRHPLQYILSQCSATVESGEPTYYRHGTAGRSTSRANKAYSRLMLPLWGQGRIAMLLGAFAWR